MHDDGGKIERFISRWSEIGQLIWSRRDSWRVRPQKEDFQARLKRHGVAIFDVVDIS
jgi:hypothetical protein